MNIGDQGQELEVTQGQGQEAILTVVQAGQGLGQGQGEDLGPGPGHLTFQSDVGHLRFLRKDGLPVQENVRFRIDVRGSIMKAPPQKAPTLHTQDPVVDPIPDLPAQDQDQVRMNVICGFHGQEVEVVL